MLVVNLDISDIMALEGNLIPAAQRALERAASELAAQTHAHIVEQVQQKLHSTREKYLGELSFRQISKDTWVVELGPKAMWIEEGMERHSMVDDLLKKGAKTAKDGSRYRSIPFKHNEAPTRQTSAGKDLTDTIKKEMKHQGVPYGKLEMGADGKPKIGLLRSFDIKSAPLKTHSGPGQGHGEVGQVRQGHTGIPFLQGVKVYQKEVQDKHGNKSVKKAIMTFRTVSSKDRGTEKWVHPGLEAKKFMDEAHDWALRQWEEKIKKQVVDQIVSGV